MLTRLLPLVLLSTALLAVDHPTSTTFVIDGSSTVYPITVAVGERYAAQNTSAGIEILCSGSTAGFRRLVAGEVPISNASRPIKPDELAKAAKAGIEVVEIPVAYDGISVVVNKHNSFVEYLTTAELKKIWEPDSTIKSWHQVRASFPDVPISLFGPGSDSGTMDYFTETIVGTARAIRQDYTGSKDPNDLVQGVVRNKGGLGYFGMSYLHDNEAVLKAIPIDNGKGPVAPSMETVANGTYRPLSRPLFLYVNKSALGRPEIRQFIDAYIAMVPTIAPQVGYVPLDQRTYELVAARVAAGTGGTMFANAHEGARIDELLMAQSVVKAPAATDPVAGAVKAPAKELPVAAKEAKPAATAQATEASAAKAPAIAAVIPVAAPATPKPAAPAPTPVRVATTAAPPALDQRRMDHLRDRAIQFARLTLDDSASLAEIQIRIEELRQLAAGMAGASTSSAALSLPEDQSGFVALIERLSLTSDGHALLDDAALARLKQTLAGITDADTRKALALALLQPGPEQLPRFTAAISAANGGKADVDAVLCYARGGFTLH